MPVNEFVQALGFGLVTASVLALAAVGLTLQFGVTNYANFAYGDIMTLGVYLTWALTTSAHLDFAIALVVAVIAMAAITAAVAEGVMGPFVRRSSPTVILLMVTFGLSLILNSVILAIWGANSNAFQLPGTQPLHFGALLLTPIQLTIIGGSLVAMLAVHLVLTRTGIGKRMRAVSDNRDLARVSGISPTPVVRATWAMTGALATLAGVSLAVEASQFSPGLGEGFLFVIFAAVILGGVGRPYGAMLGALVVGVVTEVVALWLPQYKLDVAFVVLILVLLIRPQGLIASAGKV
ncbi:MAG: branched-chain amino acid ABC transporter permease [Candidatus Dormibacteria bacterium]